jgi:hypothetical protein
MAIQQERHDVKGYTHKPKTCDDLVNISQQVWATTDGCPFLVLNDTMIAHNLSPIAKRFMMFMGRHGKEILKNCSS